MTSECSSRFILSLLHWRPLADPLLSPPGPTQTAPLSGNGSTFPQAPLPGTGVVEPLLLPTSQPPTSQSPSSAQPSSSKPHGSRHKPKPPKHSQSSSKPPVRRKRPFTRNLRYIDEDSDDEVVQQVGRPSSIHYKEPGKRPRSWLGNTIAMLSDKLKRKGLGRTPSMRSAQSVEEEPPSVVPGGDISDLNGSADTTFTGNPNETSSRRTAYEGTAV